MEKEKFDYFYGNESENFIFYRIPKKLFTDEKFSKLSSEAKTLYGLLLDRMSLSAKNNWVDEKGRVYIYFTIADAMKFMNISKGKAVKLFAELDDKNGCGLILKKRKGMGKPATIYVKNCNTDNRSKIQTSIGSKFEPQEVQYLDPNNTNINNNKFNNNYMCDIYNPILSNQGDGKDEINSREYYKKLVCENIAYKALADNYGTEQIDGIVEIMVDSISSKKDFIVIGCEDIPQQTVKEKLLKLNSSHIEYVLDCFKGNKTKVRNIRSYLLTSLYNSYSTIDYYYTAEANHDLSSINNIH